MNLISESILSAWNINTSGPDRVPSANLVSGEGSGMSGSVSLWKETKMKPGNEKSVIVKALSPNFNEM